MMSQVYEGRRFSSSVLRAKPSRAWLLLPILVFALVSVTIGVVAHQTTRSPYTVPFFSLFFSDPLHMKVWLTTAALALGIFQLLTAARIYALFPFPPKGRFYNVVHRWSGRVAIALTLPVAYHCIFLLGFDMSDPRVYIHSLLGSGFYGAFLAKVLIVRLDRFAGWVLPVAGALLFTILLGLWLTSAAWFLSIHGIGL